MAAKAPATETMETTQTTDERGGGDRAHFALGGPVYVPYFVGPITSASEFLTAVVQELQDLQAELSTAGGFDDELSIDELRVFTEEELVEKALEALKEAENGSNSANTQTERNTEMEADALTLRDNGVPSLPSGEREADALTLPDNGVPSLPSGETQLEEKGQLNKRRKKRGRRFDRDTRASELENANFNSVEQFARMKQNQDADKAAAQLHSFCGTFKPVERLTSSTAETVGKLLSLRSITSFPKVKSSNRGQQDLVHSPEVVLCVEVYDCKLTGQKTQELLVLGSQRLTALRDQIHCSTDHLMRLSRQSEPSGYFLIEGLFLNDMRNPLAVDYSKPILEWLESHRNEAKVKWEFIMANEVKTRKRMLEDLTISYLPQFKAALMDETRVCDLHFRPGSGYLYCHQGNCRHLIVIRDMRLLHSDDDQDKQSYPLLTFRIRKQPQKCSVCKINPSAMVTVDDRWASKNPCFFCKDCYYLLHYKEDGSLLYDNFRAFDLEGLWPSPQPVVP